MRKLSTLLVAVITCTAIYAQKPVYLDPSQPLESRVQDALKRMTTHEKILIIHAQSKFTSAGVPRLGIKQLNMDDGPHGVREELEWNSWSPAHWTNDSIVAFPSLTCLAATWNPALSAVYGHAVSEEFAFRGKDIMLGPGVNIARTPLNGRNFEYMGEDPYLAGTMVVPYIQAAQKNGIGCCLKHFALNDQEVNRFGVNVNIDERALNEIYLPAFKAAVKKGGVWTVMGSYNRWLGVHACQNDSLINGILKRLWGFDGALVSDWGGVTDTWQAANGGMDIEMGTFTDGKLKEAEFGYNNYYLADPFEKLINEGKIPMSVLNDKAARVLRTIFRTVMNREKVYGSQCSEAHYEACQKIGEEGIVLLKNKGILPLQQKKNARILVVGENATRSLTQGGGSSELKTLRDISPLESLRARFGDAVDYAQGYSSGRAIYDEVDSVKPEVNKRLEAEALEKARKADVIIFIGGLNKNCRQDCENSDRENYNLSFGQDKLIAELAKIQKNIIVCTFGGNAFATPWIDNVKAFVHCWYLGSMAGESLAAVLTGDVNPSGKLPVTFAKKLDDYAFIHYGKEAYPGIDNQVSYKEGLYVGYRHFDTHHVKPQFPFGYGLSYTTFRYGRPHISATSLTADGKITVSVDVTNTGRRDGKEVVQLYIGQQQPSEPRPAKELKSFEKVYLKAGETKTVNFSITPEMLAFYSDKLHTWTTENDTFHAYVCTSSEDVKGKVDFSYHSTGTTTWDNMR